MGISAGSIEKIMQQELGMLKVCALWVRQSLTPEMKLRREGDCRQLLSCIEDNPGLLCKITNGVQGKVPSLGPGLKDRFNAVATSRFSSTPKVKDPLLFW